MAEIQPKPCRARRSKHHQDMLPPDRGSMASRALIKHSQSRRIYYGLPLLKDLSNDAPLRLPKGLETSIASRQPRAARNVRPIDSPKEKQQSREIILDNAAAQRSRHRTYHEPKGTQATVATVNDTRQTIDAEVHTYDLVHRFRRTLEETSGDVKQRPNTSQGNYAQSQQDTNHGPPPMSRNERDVPDSAWLWYSTTQDIAHVRSTDQK